MTVTAPPRPPRRPSDPVTHEQFDALVEAVIEEARQRGRRRRRRNGAIVTLVALVGVAVFALVGGGAQSQTASPAFSAPARLAAAAAKSKHPGMDRHHGESVFDHPVADLTSISAGPSVDKFYICN